MFSSVFNEFPQCCGLQRIKAWPPSVNFRKKIFSKLTSPEVNSTGFHSQVSSRLYTNQVSCSSKIIPFQSLPDFLQEPCILVGCSLYSEAHRRQISHFRNSIFSEKKCMIIIINVLICPFWFSTRFSTIEFSSSPVKHLLWSLHSNLPKYCLNPLKTA